MARETKVGLLAGLAFIICFAVILANRGRQDTIAALTPRGEHVRSLQYPGVNHDSRGDASPVGEPVPQSDPVATLPVGTYRPTPARLRRTDPQEEGWRDAPQTGSFAPTSTPTPDHTRTTRASVTLDSHAEGESEAVASVERNELLKQRLRDRVRQEGRLQGRPASEEQNEPAAPEPVPPVRPARTPPVQARYTVVPGDTLSRIAMTLYGSRSARFVNAIFDGNRAILSDPDKLRVGMELVIPNVTSDVSSVPKPRAEGSDLQETAPRVSPAAESESRTWRTYQIRKNDRYMSIAREQLGDAGRWREIYELNKAIFPDAGRIRAGVNIKLPVGGARKGPRG